MWRSGLGSQAGRLQAPAPLLLQANLHLIMGFQGSEYNRPGLGFSHGTH